MSRPAPPERQTYTVREAAKLLGLGRTLTYEACRRGDLPSVRCGKKILIPRRALEEWLNGGATAPEGGDRTDPSRP